MNKSIRIEAKQLAILMGASLLTDSFIQPFGRESTPQSAQLGIFSFAIEMLVFAALFRVLRSKNNTILQTKTTTALFLIITLLSVALEIIQGERFYNYVMQSKLSVGAFLGIVFVIGFYGVYSGLDALSRTAAMIVALTIFSMFLLIVSISSQLRFTNLQPAILNLKTIANSAISQLYLPPELFFWSILFANSDSNQKNQSSHIAPVLGLLFAAGSLFSLIGEMTLGYSYQQQEHPLFTIARLGGISVFRRLDALHVSVWLLLFLIKVTVYLSMLILLIKKLFPNLKHHWPYYITVTSVLGIFLIAWSQAENTAYKLQQSLLAILFILALVIPTKQREQLQ